MHLVGLYTYWSFDSVCSIGTTGCPPLKQKCAPDPEDEGTKILRNVGIYQSARLNITEDMNLQRRSSSYIIAHTYPPQTPRNAGAQKTVQNAKICRAPFGTEYRSYGRRQYSRYLPRDLAIISINIIVPPLPRLSSFCWKGNGDDRTSGVRTTDGKLLCYEISTVKPITLVAYTDNHSRMTILL